MIHHGTLGDDWRHVESVENAEAHHRDFDDFLVTLDAQVDCCDTVKRLTLIEQSFNSFLTFYRRLSDPVSPKKIRDGVTHQSGGERTDSGQPPTGDGVQKDTGKAIVVGGPSTIIASISHVSAVDVDMRKTQSFITRRGQSSLRVTNLRSRKISPQLLRSISTVHVACEPFPEYVKRKRAFRLATQDGAEYVFRCAD
ncbi:unnamed protein product [Nippostrongylus brasiliensis]|uniref:SH2B adapter protein 2 n=1 Tax=Nippostrongylus brasiliensis TaxID=27835 RepID=A0A0N4YX07_NIPBR|nr:unnamed protein product [Nippostrongylus brasiliensis]